MNRSHSARGITLTDVLIGGTMLLMAGLVVIPALAAATREQDNRIKCSSNMRMIGLAMKMYANSETRTTAFPHTLYDPESADTPTAYTHPEAADPFLDGGPDANDVTAGLFMLLRTQEITQHVFVCPSTQLKAFRIPAGKNVRDFSNFASAETLSYSMQNPYPTAAGVKNGFKWNDEMNADFAILSDMSPGGKGLLTLKMTDNAAAQTKANSPNHGFDGQNVLYADCHVEWSASVWAGAQRDNIFTHRAAKSRKSTDPAAGIDGPPANDTDSVMLPTWDSKIAFPVIDRDAPSIEPARKR